MAVVTKQDMRKVGGAVGSAFSVICSMIWKILCGIGRFLNWAVLSPLDKHWFSYVRGRMTFADHRVTSIRFVHYGDPIFLWVMVLVSAVCLMLAKLLTVGDGWVLFTWWLFLFLTIIALIKDLGAKELGWLGLIVACILLAAWGSTLQWHWNPLAALRNHIVGLEVTVSHTFYTIGVYAFSLLVVCTILYAWMYNRVEIDKSYVQMRRFPWGMRREQLFARPVDRNARDIVEAILFASADITVYLAQGRYLLFKNVPFAAFGKLARAIDALIDYRPAAKETTETDDAAVTQVRPEDADDHEDSVQHHPDHAHHEHHEHGAHENADRDQDEHGTDVVQEH